MIFILFWISGSGENDVKIYILSAALAALLFSIAESFVHILEGVMRNNYVKLF